MFLSWQAKILHLHSEVVRTGSSEHSTLHSRFSVAVNQDITCT